MISNDKRPKKQTISRKLMANTRGNTHAHHWQKAAIQTIQGHNRERGEKAITEHKEFEFSISRN